MVCRFEDVLLGEWVQMESKRLQLVWMDGEFEGVQSPSNGPERVISVSFVTPWEEANALEELENEVGAPVILLDECIH